MLWFKQFWKKNSELKRLKKENKILKAEIIFLKKLLYGIQLDK